MFMEENSQDQNTCEDKTTQDITSNEETDCPSQEPINENSDEFVISSEVYKQLLRERDVLAEQVHEWKNKEISFQDVIKKLEEKCLQQQEELDTIKEEKKQCTESKKKLQIELNTKVAELAKSVSNEEAMMARLASLDKERMNLLDEQVMLERKCKESSKELEKTSASLKNVKADLSKYKSSHEKSEKIATEKTSEATKLKNEVSTLNGKLKWAQNKLKTEAEAHKETKSQLSTTTKKLTEVKEESDQIRSDLKKMIAQYQESEEMRSNSLGIKLKETEEELRQNEQEIADQQQLHQLTVKDLELNQASLELAQKECQQLKTRVSELTNQILEKQVDLDKMKTEMDNEKKQQKLLQDEILAMREMNNDIEKERQSCIALQESHNYLQKSHQHLEREVNRRKEKESELLTFSEKLSSANAELVATKQSLISKLETLEQEMETLKKCCNDQQVTIKDQKANLTEIEHSSQKRISSLMQSLQDKSTLVEQLSISLDEEREKIVAIQRKHSNNIKDLQRQVQLYSKRIEQLESSCQSDVATLPIMETDYHSAAGLASYRSNSFGSLMGDSMNNVHVLTLPSSDNNRMPSPEEMPLITQSHSFKNLDSEKTVLVEKLCQLQRNLAKKEDKLEFYESHCHQLMEDIKQKSKLIQHFIMREEAGALIPPEADIHKVQLSRKPSIMSSVFSGSSQKPSSEMTLELSLEINRKMQAVLEDTILKNITLKESLNTLGQEVAKLSSQLQTFQKLNCSINHSQFSQR